MTGYSLRQRPSQASAGHPNNEPVSMFAPRRRSDAISRAAEAITGLEVYAREVEARSGFFEEELKRAERDMQSMQADSGEAQALIADLNEQIRELEKALGEEIARVAAAEMEMSQLERRTLMAEARVAEMNAAIRRADDAIHTKQTRGRLQTWRRAG